MRCSPAVRVARESQCDSVV